MDLFILAGQSNMNGRGRTNPGEVPKESKTRKRPVRALDANCVWNEAIGGVYTYENFPDHMHFINPEKVGLGPGLRFAERVAEEVDGPSDIGLVPTAVGGSEIKLWHPETGKLYKEAIRRIKEAQKSGVVRALLWHQGESDATETKCNDYGERLREVIAGFRRDLKAPNLLVLVGTLGSYLQSHFDQNMFGKWRVVNEQIRSIAKEDGRIYLVEAEDLPSAGDNLHFSAESAQRLGERYFDEYAKALQDETAFNEPSVNYSKNDLNQRSSDGKARALSAAGGLYYLAGALVLSGSLAYVALTNGSF